VPKVDTKGMRQPVHLLAIEKNQSERLLEKLGQMGTFCKKKGKREGDLN